MNPNAPYALVVDDDFLIRMDACEILKEAGFRCFKAATGEAALEILDKHGSEIQLLFTDVQMPPGEMTGFELAQVCARDWPDIGILVASGGTMPEPGEMPEGAVFIGKPFSAQIVHDHLQEILPDGKKPEPLKNSDQPARFG
ncbi:MAG: response regulator [Paracoccus sp. (in: a-proteobacteria)]|uniref:response regulator n=1 Tax=Paracoccus sp. TaxID=267 RepID=UPI003242E23F